MTFHDFIWGTLSGVVATVVGNILSDTGKINQAHDLVSKIIGLIVMFLIGIGLFIAVKWIWGSTSQRPIISTEIEMVRVDGGEFIMGCTEEQKGDCFEDEMPTHRIKINSFYISKYEITQNQYKEVMGTSCCYDCSDCPVFDVSWEDAVLFAKEMSRKTGKNYRLPTEAEWEYAARGGIKSKKSKYSGSFAIEKVAWYAGNTALNKDMKNGMHIVGQKEPNELGIYDMSGNVWEWCSDWYEAHNSSSKVHENSEKLNYDDNKVLRGGSWTNDATFCRVSNRSRQYQDPNGVVYIYGYPYFSGIRLVMGE